MILKKHIVLIDYIEDKGFYIVETLDETFDVEKLSTVEKYIKEKSLLAFWVGDPEKRPNFVTERWHDDCDDYEIIDVNSLGIDEYIKSIWFDAATSGTITWITG